MSDPYREYEPVHVERVERGSWSGILTLLLLVACVAVATLIWLDAMSPNAKHATTGAAPGARPIDSRSSDESVDPRKFRPGGRLDAAKSGDDAIDARRATETIGSRSGDAAIDARKGRDARE